MKTEDVSTTVVFEKRLVVSRRGPQGASGAGVLDRLKFILSCSPQGISAVRIVRSKSHGPGYGIINRWTDMKAGSAADTGVGIYHCLAID